MKRLVSVLYPRNIWGYIRTRNGTARFGAMDMIMRLKRYSWFIDLDWTLMGGGDIFSDRECVKAGK